MASRGYVFGGFLGGIFVFLADGALPDCFDDAGEASLVDDGADGGCDLLVIEEPLLNPYSAPTQPLLNPYSTPTQPLLNPYSAPTQVF